MLVVVVALMFVLTMWRREVSGMVLIEGGKRGIVLGMGRRAFGHSIAPIA